MKKLFTLLAIHCFAITAFCQKDLALRMTSPDASTKIYVNESFRLNFSVKNVGNSMVLSSDSIYQRMKLDGNYVTGGFFDLRTITHSNMKPGDSVSFSYLFTMTSKMTTPVSFCLEMTGKNGGFLDSFPANNQGCTMITVEERTNTVDELNLASAIQIYPNPATDLLVIQANNVQATKAIFTDLTGRGVAEVKLINGLAQIPVSGFENGMYMCSILDKEGNVIITERVVVL